MLFKRLSYLTFSLLFLITCAEEDSNGVKLDNTISSIEEVNALIAETRFVIEMPNGQVVDFVPAEQFSKPSSSNYTSVGNGFNYSKSRNPFVVNGSSNNSSKLTLGDEVYQLPITFCFSASEFGEILGIAVDPIFRNYEIYFALESGDYSDLEVADFEPVGVDNFLILSGDQNGSEFDFGDAFFYREDGFEFLLLGNYQASSNGIVAQGEAYMDGFDIAFAEEFAAEIECN